MLYFVGNMLGSFTMPAISDQVGRRPVFLVQKIVQVFATVTMLYTTNMRIAQAMMFVTGVGQAGNLTYSWMGENTRAADLAQMSVTFLATDALTLLWTSLFFQYVSRDWRYLIGGTVILSVLGIVYNLMFQAESPKYHYSLRQFDEARKILKLIAR